MSAFATAWRLGHERDKLSARTGGDRHTAAGAAKGTCAGLRLDGFERARWIEVPKLGHGPPDAAWFERGLALLEAEPVPAPTTRPTNDLRPGPGQVAQARRILATALSSIEASRKSGRAPGPAANQYLRQAVDEYPTTPVADEPRRLLDELTRLRQTDRRATGPAAGFCGDSMKRSLLNSVTALSLLLCVAVGVTWMRGQRSADWFHWTQTSEHEWRRETLVAGSDGLYVSHQWFFFDAPGHARKYAAGLGATSGFSHEASQTQKNPYSGSLWNRLGFGMMPGRMLQRSSKIVEEAEGEAEGEVMPPPDARRPFWPKPREGYLLALNFAVLFGWMLATDYLQLRGWVYWASGLIPAFGCWLNERLADRWLGPKQPLP